ncbi:tRNA (N(6)-L-threonylcarbamoyladenosine(37)-C(2))-methylthiotransferase MtaB [Abyssisolibacter fermentans]|uniref:tRNA (N(6)-L-threonylcarbamoyladenosine(37)-C(2))- methylthiotransferase MtaB n=1 Tax=Abyssisolibacter fermentans TaxID=1766203 RepID=UPI003B8337B7
MLLNNEEFYKRYSRKKLVAMFTLGCKVNQYETEAMAELFEKAGYEVVEPEKGADIYVINTCTVTNLGERKSRQFIRKAKKCNKNSIIAVVGCYSQIAPEEVSSMKDVDIVLGTNDRKNIVEYCEEFLKEKRKINAVNDIMDIDEFEELSITSIKDRTRAYLKIQEGCNQYCSYCIIPYARGRIRSREIDNIKAEVKKLCANGFKEIVLTGIHIASYGKDLNKGKLIDVIEQIHDTDGLERIRLGSLEPNLITEDFMQRIHKLPKVCDHFHLSLQSGCDKILKRMNRKYTTQQYSQNVDTIRKYMPNAGITTDIIVGFPGETDEDFKITCEFAKKIGFSKIHVFKYSPRKGTPAASYKEQVLNSVKTERSKILTDIARGLTMKFLNKFINLEVNVLFEQAYGNDIIKGHTKNYIEVITKGNVSKLHSIYNLKIDAIDGEMLTGTIIE